eukprot:2727472-Pyramimonas_sp.AAC.1
MRRRRPQPKNLVLRARPVGLDCSARSPCCRADISASTGLSRAPRERSRFTGPAPASSGLPPTIRP